jgi:hypothetical protein
MNSLALKLLEFLSQNFGIESLNLCETAEPPPTAAEVESRLFGGKSLNQEKSV